MSYGFKELCDELGLESEDEIMDFLEQEVSDSICEGICKDCGALNSCEPDARNNYCVCCESQSVESSLSLKGLI